MANKLYLKAKDLAELLLQNPDDIVAITSPNFELAGAWVTMDARTKLLRFNGDFKDESFRDAFDGDRYTTEVIHLNQDHGKHKFVKL